MPKPPSFVKPRTQVLLSQDKLDAITTLITEAGVTEKAIAVLEEKLKILNARHYSILHTDLPDILEQAAVTRVTTAEYDIQLTSYYSANIPVGWPDDKRQVAFDWLTINGHEDLITTQITVQFARDQYHVATLFMHDVEAQGYSAIMKETINHNTLKAWLKEQVEKYNTIPPLEIIGGTVGRVVKIKELDK